MSRTLLPIEASKQPGRPGTSTHHLTARSVHASALALVSMALFTGCSTIRTSHAEMVALSKSSKSSTTQRSNVPVIVDVQAPSHRAEHFSDGSEVAMPTAVEPPAPFPLLDLDPPELAADVKPENGIALANASVPKTTVATAIPAVAVNEDGPVLPTAYTAQKPKPLPHSVMQGTEPESAEEEAELEVVPGLEDLTVTTPAEPCASCEEAEILVAAPEVVYYDEAGNPIELASQTAPAGHVTISPIENAKADEEPVLTPADPPAPLPINSNSAKPIEGSYAPREVLDAMENNLDAMEKNYSAPPAENVNIIEEVRPVRIVGVYGVGEDKEGLADNFSTRIGGTYYQIEESSSGGVSGILEGSGQIHSTPFFVHGGVASELINNEWPVGFSIGMSRLATIENGRVVRPWIFSVAYDGYFDTTFFETNDTVYLDQLRGLVGYAIKPWLDVGVWGAKGLSSDFGIRSQSGALFNVTGRFADRVASYAAFDLWNCLFIVSGGWEEGPGTYFGEGDVWVPLTRGCNLFGGAGFSDNGAVDAICGLEFKFGHDKHPWLRHFKSKHHAGYASAAGCYNPCDPCATDACNPCCEEVVCCYCDPCTPRYRGGWANDPYRGALRVISPSRMRRMFEDPTPRLLPPVVTAAAPPPPVVTVQPPPVVQDPGNVSVDPQHPDGECEPGHPSRNLYRPTRDSRLAQWLSQHQSGTP